MKNKKESKKASNESMQDLHCLLAKTLAEGIKSDGCSPSLLNVARQFLKDNCIDATVEKGTEIEELKETINFDSLKEEFKLGG
jgi:hypothetical protein